MEENPKGMENVPGFFQFISQFKKVIYRFPLFIEKNTVIVQMNNPLYTKKEREQTIFRQPSAVVTGAGPNSNRLIEEMRVLSDFI